MEEERPGSVTGRRAGQRIRECGVDYRRHSLEPEEALVCLSPWGLLSEPDLILSVGRQEKIDISSSVQSEWVLLDIRNSPAGHSRVCAVL